jgi:hypothetical protein
VPALAARPAPSPRGHASRVSTAPATIRPRARRHPGAAPPRRNRTLRSHFVPRGPHDARTQTRSHLRPRNDRAHQRLPRCSAATTQPSPALHVVSAASSRRTHFAALCSRDTTARTPLPQARRRHDAAEPWLHPLHSDTSTRPRRGYTRYRAEPLPRRAATAPSRYRAEPLPRRAATERDRAATAPRPRTRPSRSAHTCIRTCRHGRASRTHQETPGRHETDDASRFRDGHARRADTWQRGARALRNQHRDARLAEASMGSSARRPLDPERSRRR